MIVECGQIELEEKTLFEARIRSRELLFTTNNRFARIYFDDQFILVENKDGKIFEKCFPLNPDESVFHVSQPPLSAQCGIAPFLKVVK